jgi:peptidyl-prolyl cis-trans isomerase A (cyclophilin A)
MTKARAGEPIWATFVTSEGKFTVALFSKEAPETVSNFVGLAAGEKEYTDPRTQKKAKGPFFDGVIFHRIIPNFMIQGGDPTGTGRGDPGYKFNNEQNAHRFDRPGILAMANAGPNTNGSQFFITVAAKDYLNGGYTIFGEVVEGYPVVEKISNVKTGPMDRPVKDVVIKKIELKDPSPAPKAAAGASPKKG